jgi:hypothetical protein
MPLDLSKTESQVGLLKLSSDLNPVNQENIKRHAVSVDRTRDLQIFSLTLSQLSYPRNVP